MMRFSRPALLGIFMAQSSSISDERKVYFFVALPFADCCRFFFLSKKREPIGDCTPISFKRPLAGQRRGYLRANTLRRMAGSGDRRWYLFQRHRHIINPFFLSLSSSTARGRRVAGCWALLSILYRTGQVLLLF